jgi:hypothetical protein
MKKTVVRDENGKVVHIGAWDAKTFDPIIGGFVDNPMPAHYTVCEADVVEGADGGLYAAEDHAIVRRNSYPQIADQLDALWKGGDAANEMRARVLAVKEKYPKP